MADHGQGASAQLEQLVAAVLAGARYRHIDSGLIRTIGAGELAKGRPPREAVKATRNRLHQVAAAYQVGRMRYDAWLAALRHALCTGDEARFRATCHDVMEHHASTRERLPILEHFYTTILADLPPIRRVVDIACGLNPLTLPWMPLAADAAYYAYDIYTDMVEFLNGFLTLTGTAGEAQAWDVVHACPPQAADVAFLLKAIPCLEQIDPAAGARLLDTIDAPFLVVSFPAQSLGGRRKGMPANYASRFRELVAGRPWRVHRFEFRTELVFLVVR